MIEGLSSRLRLGLQAELARNAAFAAAPIPGG